MAMRLRTHVLLLRNAVSPVADRIWREGQSAELQSAPFKAASQGEAFFHEIQDLQPSSDNQREIKQRLLQITTDAAQARYLLFSHLGSSIPIPFLAVGCSGWSYYLPASPFWHAQTQRHWAR